MSTLQLIKDTREGETIALNFAYRERIHKNVPLHIIRLYHKLSHDDKTLDKDRFIQVFKALQTEGFGEIVPGPRGATGCFKPKMSLKDIGQTLIKGVTLKTETKPVTPPADTTKIVVLFSIKGRGCKAEVPEAVLSDFTKLVGF